MMDRAPATRRIVSGFSNTGLESFQRHSIQNQFFLVGGLVCYLFLIAIPSYAQSLGNRTFLSTDYTPGLPVYVKIKVTGPLEESTVAEIPPEGWIIDNVYLQGKISHGVILWDLAPFSETQSGIKNLAYTVRPPRSMAGSAYFFGKVNQQEISGMNKLVPAPRRMVGVFQNHLNVGKYASGEALYENKSDEYRLVGGGVDQSLDMHFAYREMDGDFCLRGKARVDSIRGSQGNGMLGLIIREHLSLNSGFGMIWINRNDEIGSLWPDSTWHLTSMDSEIKPISLSGVNGGWLELKRTGQVVSLSCGGEDGRRWTLLDQKIVDWVDPVYTGLAALSFETNAYVEGTFSHVYLTPLLYMEGWIDEETW